MEQRFAGTGAAQARLGPRLAASAAARARAANRDDERQHAAVERLASRERKFGLEHIVRRGLAEKRIAHPFDHAAGGRKIDGDFIGKTLVRHIRTIGARSRDVKVVLVCSHVYGDERMSAVRHDNAIKGIDGERPHSRQSQADDASST